MKKFYRIYFDAIWALVIGWSICWASGLHIFFSSSYKGISLPLNLIGFSSNFTGLLKFLLFIFGSWLSGTLVLMIIPFLLAAVTLKDLE